MSRRCYLLVLCVALAGCGSGKYAPVSGTVTLNGKALSGVMVTFQPLAVTGGDRIAGLPTFKEAGLPGGDAGTWQGILTRAGTPPAMVTRLNDEIGKILEMPEIKAKIAEQGGVVKAGPPAEFSAWLNDATTRWGGIIREAGIKGS